MSLRLCSVMFLFFFFFSSRRRHTRSLRDWSSDVCSSDLLLQGAPTAAVSASPRLSCAFSTLRRRDQLFRALAGARAGDRKSTRLNSSHVEISYAVFCLKKKKTRAPPSTASRPGRRHSRRH